jgi:hypothetical protein
MAFGRDAGHDVGRCSEARRIAAQKPLAQRVRIGGEVDLVAFAPERRKRVEERTEYGQMRSATIRATRPASMSARSGSQAMSRRPVWRPLPAAAVRPPNMMEPVAPSISGSATIIVVSTGVRPCSLARHCSSDWNSSAKAERYGTSSRASIASAAAASL